MRRPLILLALVLTAAGSLSAQDRYVADTLRLHVEFRTGSSTVDPGYKGNAAYLRSFYDSVNELCRDSSIIIHSINIITGSSPEGDFQKNKRLSLERGKNIREHILSNTTLSPSQVKAYYAGVDWGTLVRVVKGSDCPWRDEIVDIIDGTVGSGSLDDEEEARICSARLQNIDGGDAWRWLLENLFPETRGANCSVRCYYEKIRKQTNDTLVVVHRDTVYYNMVGVVSEEVSEEDIRREIADELTVIVQDNIRKSKLHLDSRDPYLRKTVAAVRTNLLLPLTNIGVEVPVGNRVSLALDVYAPWCPRPLMDRITGHEMMYCCQILAGWIEARYWFGENHRHVQTAERYRLLGHSLGLVGGYGIYDLERMVDGKGAGIQGGGWAAGLGYRYSLPLGRKAGLMMEFELAAGYFSTDYLPYTVHMEGGYLIHNKGEYGHRGFWGPIKAGVNLVVPIHTKR